MSELLIGAKSAELMIGAKQKVQVSPGHLSCLRRPVIS